MNNYLSFSKVIYETFVMIIKSYYHLGVAHFSILQALEILIFSCSLFVF